jgi:hypothetical protein
MGIQLERGGEHLERPGTALIGVTYDPAAGGPGEHDVADLGIRSGGLGRQLVLAAGQLITAMFVMLARSG